MDDPDETMTEPPVEAATANQNGKLAETNNANSEEAEPLTSDARSIPSRMKLLTRMNRFLRRRQHYSAGKLLFNAIDVNSRKHSAAHFWFTVDFWPLGLPLDWENKAALREATEKKWGPPEHPISADEKDQHVLPVHYYELHPTRSTLVYYSEDPMDKNEDGSHKFRICGVLLLHDAKRGMIYGATMEDWARRHWVPKTATGDHFTSGIAREHYFWAGLDSAHFPTRQSAFAVPDREMGQLQACLMRICNSRPEVMSNWATEYEKVKPNCCHDYYGVTAAHFEQLFYSQED